MVLNLTLSRPFKRGKFLIHLHTTNVQSSGLASGDILTAKKTTDNCILYHCSSIGFLKDIDQGLGYPGLGLYMMFEPHLISLDKLKMGANTEFALQVILIWVVFRTMHQFVPGICKV